MKKLISIMLCVVHSFSFSATNPFIEFVLKITIPGIPAGRIYVPNDSHKMDFNGDNAADVAFLTVDPNNPNLVSLVIYSGANPDQKWQIPLPNGIIAILVGFYDLDGTINTSNQKEIIIAEKKGNRYINPVVIHSDDNYETVEFESFGVNSVFVAAGDINNDGLPEILVHDPEAKNVQVWGYQ